ncbi:hypothetical protein BDF22DRAFT_675533 [Syncephalis plumigaleata]|nr:hypothetical protein BDF22DRAFT_675533 [Syncephalis plumigaleata]
MSSSSTRHDPQTDSDSEHVSDGSNTSQSMEYNKNKTANAYIVSAGEERERELDEFRRQWAAEVVARQQKEHKHEGEEQQRDKAKQIPLDSTHVSIDDTASALQHLTLNEQSSAINTTNGNNNTSPTMVTRTSIDNNHPVRFETQNQLGDALKHYQQAFRIDPNVDRNFHKLYPNGVVTTELEDKEGNDNQLMKGEDAFVRTIQWNEDYQPHHRRHLHKRDKRSAKETYRKIRESNPFYQLLDDIRSQTTAIAINDDSSIDTAPMPLLFRLPREILLRIAQCLGLIEIRSLMRFSQTSRLSLVLVYDPSVWRLLCERDYTASYTEDRLLTSVTATRVKLQQELNMDYYGDWHLMFIDRPRIRIDGVYISTCFYIRNIYKHILSPGTFGNVLSYIRFFRDGRCLLYMTSDVPQAGLMRGRWSIDEAEVRIEAVDAQRPNLIFYMELNLRSTSRGRHNKLAWQKYYSTDALRDYDPNEYH